jgi:hypothetical protein
VLVALTEVELLIRELLDVEVRLLIVELLSIEVEMLTAVL